MHPDCLQYQLSQTLQSKFEDEGYLHLEQVLAPEQIAPLETTTDSIWERQKSLGLGPDENLFYPNFVGSQQCFVDLLDHPRVFPLVWGLLSWNIQLYHSHLGVTPQEGEAGQPLPARLGFHQDSGRVNQELEGHPRPRLSLKVSFWLSDCSEEGRGNFYIVPGSHLNDDLQRPEQGLPEGAIPVLARPGDVVFFDRRLWHARSPNHSPIVRKVLFYGYAYRWLRTKDNMTVLPHLYESCSPIRRQLLGGGTKANGFFSPTDEDVPLKVWLEEHKAATPV
ncbi:MAG: hypothetical protein GKR89_32535 [Candidatus Latescibacteria bacterium]|nr:hypothetical protein [Candidatus Latescibacterota bacterium]